MGYRVKVKVGRRTLYTKSYPSKASAKRAKSRTRGAKGIVES